jgi:tRNA(fMet)-specific endonuclease VapC
LAETAADLLKDLRRQKVRVATMELKIATIASVHSSLLLSANLPGFELVPHLRVEDWLP